MSPDDVIEMPGQAGKWGRRALIDALVAAGSPPINSLGRLKSEQQYFYDGWVRRLPGFNPADNPNDPSQALAHVRFVGADIDPTPERVAALQRAGLVRPYSYEPWHWQLPGDVRRFALVTSLPAPSSTNSRPFPTTTKKEIPTMFIAIHGPGWFLVIPQGNGKPRATVMSGNSQQNASGGNDLIPRITYDDAAWQQLRTAVDGLPA